MLVIGAVYLGRRAYKYFREREFHMPWRKKSHWEETAESEHFNGD
jgi:hypothetical protein